MSRFVDTSTEFMELVPPKDDSFELGYEQGLAGEPLKIVDGKDANEWKLGWKLGDDERGNRTTSLL
jgi:hypothetical protein